MEQTEHLQRFYIAEVLTLGVQNQVWAEPHLPRLAADLQLICQLQEGAGCLLAESAASMFGSCFGITVTAVANQPGGR